MSRRRIAYDSAKGIAGRGRSSILGADPRGDSAFSLMLRSLHLSIETAFALIADLDERANQPASTLRASYVFRHLPPPTGCNFLHGYDENPRWYAGAGRLWVESRSRSTAVPM